jgi:hypothetical protein
MVPCQYEFCCLISSVKPESSLPHRCPPAMSSLECTSPAPLAEAMSSRMIREKAAAGGMHPKTFLCHNVSKGESIWQKPLRRRPRSRWPQRKRPLRRRLCPGRRPRNRLESPIWLSYVVRNEGAIEVISAPCHKKRIPANESLLSWPEIC